MSRRVSSIVAALCMAGCTQGPPGGHRGIYYRWLETIPCHPIAVRVTGNLNDADLSTFHQIGKGRLEGLFWFSEVRPEPVPDGYYLELDCDVQVKASFAHPLVSDAEVAWVLSRLGPSGSTERICVASGRSVGTASGRSDPDWLKGQAFRDVLDAILRTFSERLPIDPICPVVTRTPTDKTVAPFRFRLTGKSYERGLGMADGFVFDGLTTSRWVRVLAPRDLEMLIHEINLSESDTAEERSRKVGGAIKGAEALLFGTVAEHNECMEIEVRLVDVSTGAVLNAAHGGCYRTEQLRATCNGIVNRLSAQDFGSPALEKPRIAVALITDRSPEAKQQELGACFGSLITAALVRGGGLCVLERTWMQQILSERNLVTSDLVSQHIGDLAKLLVADYLVIGDVGRDSLSVSVIQVREGGANLPLEGTGTVKFMASRSLWEPAEVLANRIQQAIQAKEDKNAVQEVGKEA